ncbi:MAG: YceD family protein [Dissulfurispiraceae bacterium]
MKIVVSDIPEEGVKVEIQEHSPIASVKMLSPLHAVMSVDKQNTQVLIKGVVTGDVELECSRCLKEFGMNIKSEMDVVYHPIEEIGKDDHHELKDAELDAGFYRNDVIDTDDLFVEQLLLGIPMKPLCSSQCKGLCPKCGIDLNVRQCGCELKEIHPQFEMLKELLKRKE